MPSALAECASFWNDFNLEAMRAKLETEGEHIATRQQQSTASRKELSSATKAFRRAPDADKLGAFGPLLKRYQKEVDHLTRRARAGEKAYRSLCKSLYDAPDPALLLSQSTDNEARLADATAKVKSMSRDLATYKAELSALKNQDITIRRLEDELEDYKDKVDDMVAARVANMESELTQRQASQDVALKDREQELELQVTASRESLLEAEHRAEASGTRLFEVQRQMEELSAATQSELAILSEDVERYRNQTELLSQENSQLRRQVATIKNDPAPGQVAALRHAQQQLAHEREQVEKLGFDLRASRDEVATLRAATAASGEAEERQVEAQARRIAELEARLAKKPSDEAVERWKRKLLVVSALEFDGVPQHMQGDGGGDGVIDAATADEDEDERLATWVRDVVGSRVAKLQAQCTQDGMALRERDEKLRTLRKRLAQSEERLGDHRALVAKLEDALSRRTGSIASAGTGESGSGNGSSDSPPPSSSTAAAEDGATVVVPGAANDGGAFAVPAAAAAAAAGSAAATSSSSGGGAAAAGTSLAASETSMVQILREQRDRFRARAQEQEVERGKLNMSLKTAKQTIEDLRNDNVQMFEKIRFLESYKASGGARSGTVGDAEAGRSRQVALAAAVPEARYAKLYEQRMNPFGEFRRNEAVKRMQNLNLAERVVISSGSIILAHPILRRVLFFYLLSLHFLVFFSLHHTNEHSAKASAIIRQSNIVTGRGG